MYSQSCGGSWNLASSVSGTNRISGSEVDPKVFWVAPRRRYTFWYYLKFWKYNHIVLIVQEFLWNGGSFRQEDRSKLNPTLMGCELSSSSFKDGGEVLVDIGIIWYTLKSNVFLTRVDSNCVLEITDKSSVSRACRSAYVVVTSC